MSEFIHDHPEDPRSTGRTVSYVYRELIPVGPQGLAHAGGAYATLPPMFNLPAVSTQPVTYTQPAASTNPRLTEQSEPTNLHPGIPIEPFDAASLYSAVKALQAEVRAIARSQAEQAPRTPITTSTTTTTTTPLPCTIASGRGAGSPEVFQEMIKTNWHGRLGRTHMVEVDGLPEDALTALDRFLRQNLQTIFLLGAGFSSPDAGAIFTGLEGLGLRMEDRGGYADVLLVSDNMFTREDLARRVKNTVGSYYSYSSNNYTKYWRGFALETLFELARYRGLIDENGSLKVR